jgi:hypothetical protein
MNGRIDFSISVARVQKSMGSKKTAIVDERVWDISRRPVENAIDGDGPSIRRPGKLKRGRGVRPGGSVTSAHATILFLFPFSSSRSSPFGLFLPAAGGGGGSNFHLFGLSALPTVFFAMDFAHGRLDRPGQQKRSFCQSNSHEKPRTIPPPSAADRKMDEKKKKARAKVTGPPGKPFPPRFNPSGRRMILRQDGLEMSPMPN